MLGFDPHYVSPFSLHAAANGFNVIGTLQLSDTLVQCCQLKILSCLNERHVKTYLPGGAKAIVFCDAASNGLTLAIGYKKLSYRRETARQLHTTTWAGQLTF